MIPLRAVSGIALDYVPSVNRSRVPAEPTHELAGCVSPHEVADPVNRVSGFREKGTVPVPHVRHTLDYLELGLRASCLRPLSEPLGVIQEHLYAADLNENRGQAA